MTLDRPPPADLVVDTSALAAILLDEPAAARCAQVLDRAHGPLVSSANVVELLMVMEGRRGPVGVSETKAFLHDARLITMPVDGVTVQEAHAAWQRFGKGRHPARLNYGDCFAYALAEHWELPLLCVGDDFRHTDLALA